MHRASRMGAVAMERPMQPPSRWIRRIRPRKSVGIIRINFDNIAGFDAGKMALIWVHQKSGSVFVDGKRKMIGYGFMII